MWLIWSMTTKLWKVAILSSKKWKNLLPKLLSIERQIFKIFHQLRNDYLPRQSRLQLFTAISLSESPIRFLRRAGYSIQVFARPKQRQWGSNGNSKISKTNGWRERFPKTKSYEPTSASLFSIQLAWLATVIMSRAKLVDRAFLTWLPKIWIWHHNQAIT